MPMSFRTVAVTAILALALGLVAARAPGAGTPTLKMRAAVLNKTGDTTWSGAVLDPHLGKGTLTLTGTVEFLPKENEHPKAHVLKFDASFPKGHVRGCLRNSMYLRPGNRQVWDGLGRVTSTSPKLAVYRGMKLGEGGATPADDLTVAKPFRITSGDVGAKC
jgi:hypothetical protein